MNQTVDTAYTETEIELAKLARALGHPARIAILRHLASLDTCCFTEISNELPLAISTVSQHLVELKKAGLIQGSIEPPRIKYCINVNTWEKASELFGSFFSSRIKNTKKRVI